MWMLISQLCFSSGSLWDRFCPGDGKVSMPGLNPILLASPAKELCQLPSKDWDSSDYINLAQMPVTRPIPLLQLVSTGLHAHL